MGSQLNDTTTLSFPLAKPKRRSEPNLPMTGAEPVLQRTAVLELCVVVRVGCVPGGFVCCSGVWVGGW